MRSKQNFSLTLIFALLAALAAVTVGCGGGTESDAVSPATEQDHQLLEETSLGGVRSGYFDATFFLDNETKAEAVQWGAEGPFVRVGGTIQTNARWEFAGLEGLTLGTLLVLGDRTFFGSGGNSYRLPASPSAQVAQAGIDCRRSLESIDFATLVKNLSAKREIESIAIEGTLRLGALLSALRRLSAPAACGYLLKAAGVSPRALDALEAEVEKTFKKSEATFTFDKDHVLTGVSLGIWIETPPPGPEEIDGTLTITLTRVNEIAGLELSPSAKALDAQVREASTAQRRGVEGWISLVDAVFGALAGS